MNKQPASSTNPLFKFDEDDVTIGRIYTRREALRLLGGAAGALLLTACGAKNSTNTDTNTDLTAVNTILPKGCVVRPALTEGPVFVDNDLDRSDVRTDPSNGAISEGIPLLLTFNVSTLENNTCSPLPNAQVDIWQCDAFGVYSDTNQLGFQTVGQKFLRGWQRTDDSGMAQFTTIYPGWYEGRTVHIHFKIRTDSGQEFTSQLFFDDALSDTVFNNAPYNSRGERMLRNDDDGIYLGSGEQMVLDMQESASGYATTFNITLDMS